MKAVVRVPGWSRATRRVRDVLGLRVRAYWWRKDALRNFGDEITPYLLARLTGQPVWRTPADSSRPYVAAVGSILQQLGSSAIVWGSGIIRENSQVTPPRDVAAVRGPRSRRRLLELGIECPEVYGDPALLLPWVYQPNRADSRRPVGIVPHYTQYETVCSSGIDADVIDLRNPVEQVIREMCRCETIVASSLHGLIVAHAYGLPAVLATFSELSHTDGVKFQDYLESVGIKECDPVDMQGGIPNVGELVAMVRAEARTPRINVRPLIEAAPFRVRRSILRRITQESVA